MSFLSPPPLYRYNRVSPTCAAYTRPRRGLAMAAVSTHDICASAGSAFRRSRIAALASATACRRRSAGAAARVRTRARMRSRAMAAATSPPAYPPTPSITT